MRTLELLPEDRDIERAGAVLRGGGLVVMPTETVYGLAANALDPTAVARIYAAKGRPADNPLIVHLSDPLEIGLYAIPDERARLLAAAIWPGPLTLVLPGRGLFARPSLALRVPQQPIARRVIAAAGRPLAAPSANRSGRPSPTTFRDALGEMRGRVEAVIAGPPAEFGIESTVLDLTGPRPALLRPGAVSAETIRDLLGATELLRPAGSGRSPGTRYRHYAPEVEVTLLQGPPEAMRQAAQEALSRHPAAVYIGLGDTAPDGAAGLCAKDLAELQAGLFRTLLEAERLGRRVVAVLPAASPAAEGIRDRMIRAAAGRVVEVRAQRRAD